MGNYNKFNKGNKKKEAVGRNANFVLLVIWENLNGPCGPSRGGGLIALIYTLFVNVNGIEA